MTDFDDRLAAGEALERRIAAELEARGWTVTQWGQGILPTATRRAIREARSSFRYFPDLVASRPGEIIAIDAKDSMHSTQSGRYAVSRECVKFGIQFFAAFGLRLFYVFGNLGVMCPTEITSYGQVGPRATGGAYFLVDGRLAHIFDDVFGSPGLATAA
jgi:Holliday junction resolvase